MLTTAGSALAPALSVQAASPVQSESAAEPAAPAKGSAAGEDFVPITKVYGKLNEVSDSRKQFVLAVANYVRKYAPMYGIKVYSPIIAQAIHESGWGESSLSAKYNNYFGLKCGTLWKGKSVGGILRRLTDHDQKQFPRL